ncbi:uncharacterized protein LOC119498678 [Sebastes umbrosus]|uniref:uncharacterized protein LOC119498678 n=1 Tax=Sebastes umbrosus TaxID=72105 RepID=UPI00189C894F|nr:uncharacterized protein LOC119498678 [Sebastes umbrosus]
MERILLSKQGTHMSMLVFQMSKQGAQMSMLVFHMSKQGAHMNKQSVMSDDAVAWIWEFIQATGVERREDLKYVREEDMVEFIRPIQCRKLLDCWKSQAHPGSCPPATHLLQALRCQVVPRPLLNHLHVHILRKTKMPPELLSTVMSGKRPSPSDRQQFVRVLVDEMRKHGANPTRPQCLIITRNGIREYPQSFADTMDDGKTMIGGGYESLLSQVKVGVEHLNRNNTLTRHRASKDATGAIPARGPADSYGCTRWQPELPPEESEDSLEGLRQKMTNIFKHEGLGGAGRGEIHNLMEKTYYLQRKSINSTPAAPLEDIKSFCRGACVHTLNCSQTFRSSRVSWCVKEHCLDHNFNLQYQDHAACTLEFIQRSCVGINPERGTKE